MKRTYEYLLEEHIKNYRQMVFLAGPRQVGKTTLSLEVSKENPNHIYFSWDVPEQRALIAKGPQAVAQAIHLDSLQTAQPTIVFDEIHKFHGWKLFLKGFFDLYEKRCKIVVTGSSRLNIYKRGGDSLMGRYFLYRLHPLSVRELLDPLPLDSEIADPLEISDQDWQALLEYSGFPEPYLEHTKQFWNKWKHLRDEQLFKEDIRDLTLVQELSQIQILAHLLTDAASQLITYSNLATKVQASSPTVRRWIETLKNFYYCFTLKPWTKNISRSLLKEPKLYLWNWALVEDSGARLENFVASHLLKAVHFWTDRGFGDYDLFFLRDKEQAEVDFLVTKNKKPWFLVEVKSSASKGISKALFKFQKQTGAGHAFQVAFDLPYIPKNCFDETEPIIVPAKTFLSQLV